MGRSLAMLTISFAKAVAQDVESGREARSGPSQVRSLAGGRDLAHRKCGVWLVGAIWPIEYQGRELLALQPDRLEPPSMANAPRATSGVRHVTPKSRNTKTSDRKATSRLAAPLTAPCLGIRWARSRPDPYWTISPAAPPLSCATWRAAPSRPSRPDPAATRGPRRRIRAAPCP
jgi:hypothetical protein